MKKICVAALSVLFIVMMLGGCVSDKGQNGKLSVVATAFPAYDFARQICGEKADITLLVKPGSETHSFEPTPADMAKVNNCDVFICGGGESEAWVEGLLASGGKPGRTVLKMTELVGLIAEDAPASFVKSEDKEDGETEYDEHVWTSPVNARTISAAVAEAAENADSSNAELYRQSAAAYDEKLAALDRTFREVVAAGKRKTVVFADRFPARYFVEEYGLSFYAAFPGCAAFAEPDAKTVMALIERVQSEKIPVVFTIELSDRKMADTVCGETGAKQLLFHTCHNLSKDDFAAGETYISLMEQNAINLRMALS